MSHEEEIKNLRHSFTKSNREELETPSKNQFGHTVLNQSDKDIDTSNIKLSIGETGEPRADLSTSIFDTDTFQEWLKTTGKVVQIETFVPETIQEPIDQRKELISGLMAELDEMDTESKPRPSTMKIVKKADVEKTFKDCSNPECLYSLPHDAKFCLKCGIPQLAKFCVECGYRYSGQEKFCPDCGNRR